MHLHQNPAKSLLVLKRGEPVMASLVEATQKLGYRAAILNGIGAIEDVELGAYELDKKEYIRKTFSGQVYELVSMWGNVVLNEGKLFPHVHVVLGDHHFQTLGGHLFEAKSAVTVEIGIQDLGFLPERRPDDDIGLNLICNFEG